MAVLYRDAVPATVGEYHVASIGAAPALLRADEATWHAARVIEWGPSQYATRFRALWSHEALVIRFDCADAGAWHTMTRHDDHLWEEEVVEIFIDPAASGRTYAEIEISPANVVCDLRIVAASAARETDIAWNFEGLESRVSEWRESIGRRHGWTATALLPWDGFRSLSEAVARRLPPAAGDRWRFNVFRIKRPFGPAEPERNAIYAAWSVPDGPTFHVPAVFQDMVFV
jgi:hypothetical protein